MSRLLRRINAEHMKHARREYWDRHPDRGMWASYQTDDELTDAQVLERTSEALGAELVLIFDPEP